MTGSSTLLCPGQEVRTESSGVSCRIETVLGSGGQGEVYRARLGDQVVALKWYWPHVATPAQRAALEALLRLGPPTSRFLWPEELVVPVERSDPTATSFGYLMPLREPRFTGIVGLMKRRVEPTFRALATAGLELADSYLHLHAKGLCYQDISFGNVFFDPDTGEVRICDNDNVGVDGHTRTGVLGTPRFMAPEVVRGEALPSTHTDLFSLSVLLFYLLMVHHPLEGAREAAIRCLDLPAMLRLYGTEPRFIFDPRDDSNRPVPGIHDNALAFWPVYPAFIRALFTQSFTDGLHDPLHGRVRESEWRAAMARLRDSIIYCARCGAEGFYDAEALRATGRSAPCWSCGTVGALPPRMRLGRHIVMLNHDTTLYPHHFDEQRLYDFAQPAAVVSRHPSDPRIWGLKNLSTEKWVVVGADGTRDVLPGRSVTLALGTRIHFGKVEGEVRV